jgi:hypothetical protein
VLQQGCCFFLNHIAYRDRAIATLGSWVTVEGELGFAVLIASSLCFGGAAGAFFDRRKTSLIVGACVATVAFIVIASCYQ